MVGTLVDGKMLWQKDIPLKVVVFAWRLFRNRLPTKDDLSRRGILNDDSCLCVAGCGSLETAHHLFLHCSLFGSVWYLINSWIGFSTAVPLLPSEHFVQFNFSCGGSQVRHYFLTAI